MGKESKKQGVSANCSNLQLHQIMDGQPVWPAEPSSLGGLPWAHISGLMAQTRVKKLINCSKIFELD